MTHASCRIHADVSQQTHKYGVVFSAAAESLTVTATPPTAPVGKFTHNRGGIFDSAPENILPDNAETPYVTHLVADGIRLSLADVLPDDVVTVDAAAVRDVVARDDPDVVVVDAATVADPAAVVNTVRSTTDAAIVAIGTTALDADVACASSCEGSVRAAVERARHIASYRRSVSDLYEACRERALGRPDEDVRERRRAADEEFASLPDDREAFAAALRPEDEDG